MTLANLFQPPQIITVNNHQVWGLQARMAQNGALTQQLFQQFMPLVRGYTGNIYHIRLYDNTEDVKHPEIPFTKYAATEDELIGSNTKELMPYTIPGGLYAVFSYKGLHSDVRIFQYIYGEWLPQSGYRLDHRPHFEVLGPRYKTNDPQSEEDIYIPITPAL